MKVAGVCACFSGKLTLAAMEEFVCLYLYCSFDNTHHSPFGLLKPRYVLRIILTISQGPE